MKRATQAARLGSITPVTYVLQKKAADWPDPALPEGTVPDPTADPAAAPHQWAGDLYEEGDESLPEDAFAVLTGDGDEESWLDRADDGTLTGWVKDVDGAVYRYSDVEAWAVDVDGAQMIRVDEAFDAEAGEDVEGDPEADPLEDPEADPLADPEAEADPALEGEPADEDLEADIPDPANPFDPAAADAEEDEPVDDTLTHDGEDIEDPAEDKTKTAGGKKDDFLNRMKRGREGKSARYALHVTERG
jgi:hypothetical protein